MQNKNIYIFIYPNIYIQNKYIIDTDELILMVTTVVFFCLWPLEEPNLRHVETDVLIPKLMREKAKERCAEKVEGRSM